MVTLWIWSRGNQHMVNNNNDKRYIVNEFEFYKNWDKYRKREKHAIDNIYYVHHVSALHEVADNIKLVIDYISFENDEVNLQKAHSDSVKRCINYCYKLILYLAKENNDNKDYAIALEKISSFYQTNNNDLCFVAEPVVEYKAEDSGKVDESISIEKANNVAEPTIKISLETGIALIGLLLSFITLILDIYFHELDSIENKEPKININIDEQNIELRDIDDLIDSGEYLQKIIEQIREYHPELFRDL